MRSRGVETHLYLVMDSLEGRDGTVLLLSETVCWCSDEFFHELLDDSAHHLYHSLYNAT